MNYENMKVVDLKALTKESRLRGYSRLKKAEFITYLQNNLQPCATPPPQEPIDDRQRPPAIPAPRSPPPRPIPALRPIPAPHTRPQRPTRPPRPPPVRPRQELKLYQLKHKRGQETFIEPTPTSNQKQIKCLKKKLGKLNKKIRHSKKKHNNLISKRNSVKKKFEELKGSQEPEESSHPRQREQAFGGAYRSYRIDGRSRMDVDTLFSHIRRELIGLINRELTNVKIQPGYK